MTGTVPSKVDFFFSIVIKKTQLFLNLKCQLHSFDAHLKDHLSNSQFNTAKPRDAEEEKVRSRLPVQVCLATFAPSLLCTVLQ